MAVFKTLLVKGRPVLTVEHLADKNAHNDYVRFYGYQTLKTSGTQAGYWAKIGTVIIKAQYKHFEAKISFMSGSGSIEAQRGEWFIKIMQINPLGSAPLIQSWLSKQANVSNDQVKIALIQNDPTQTVLDLYIKIVNANDNIYFNPYHCIFDSTNMTVKWYDIDDQQALISALPNVALVDAIEDSSYSHAVMLNNQAINAATWTKVNFNSKLNDHRGEYDSSNARFIPKQSGLYIISSSIRMTSPSTEYFRSLSIYINGANAKRLAYGNGAIVQGSTIIKVKAFDRIEIYTYSQDNVTIESNSTDSFFTIASLY